MKRVLGALLLVVSACGGGKEDRLVVFAASSLTEAFTRLAPGARMSFAGSERLAFQIREGARADVFASADEEHPGRLYREGLASQPHVFATNTLVIIVPRSNSARIASFSDLRRPSLKIVAGAPEVPVGAYTRQILRAMGAQDVLARIVSEEQDVKGVVGKVALGEADAGFVYATDARSAAARVRVIELPAQVRIRYAVCVLVQSKNRAAGDAFVERLLGEEGRRVLAASGFGVP